MVNILADFVVRFNANAGKNKKYFYVPYSNIVVRIVKLLFSYRCITLFSMDVDPDTKILRIKIIPKYLMDKPIIRHIDLISKPGLRIYWTVKELAINYSRNNFQGFYVVSTSNGICTSNEFTASNILKTPFSGEILLKINL